MGRVRSWCGGDGFGGAFWFAGWLFTLGFVDLLWWQYILALVVWPYYLGVTIAVALR